jgi:hypothetical protein
MYHVTADWLINDTINLCWPSERITCYFSYYAIVLKLIQYSYSIIYTCHPVLNICSDTDAFVWTDMQMPVIH